MMKEKSHYRLYCTTKPDFELMIDDTTIDVFPITIQNQCDDGEMTMILILSLILLS